MGKGTFIGVVYFRHLRDGKGQAVGNGTDMVDFVETEGTALPGFQVFVDDLITTDVEVPHLRWYRREMAGLVDVNGLFFGGIADYLHHMFARAMIYRQLAPLLFAEQMGVHKSIAKFRKFIKLRFGVNERNVGDFDEQDN